MNQDIRTTLAQLLLLATTALAQGPGLDAGVPNAAPNACTSIPVDVSICESLSNPGEEDCYTFTASAGQRVTAFLDNNASDYLSLRLIKPDGTSWYTDFNYWDSEIDNVTLPMAGEYQLRVAGRGSATGNYCVAINMLGDRENTIIYNQPIEDNLSPFGDQDSFVFQGTAGQRITAFLKNRASSYLSLRVTKPDGSSWYSDYSYWDGEIDNVTLPATGEYVVTVNARDDGQGNYTVAVNLLSDPPTPIAYDQPLDDNLSPFGDQDTFVFQGAAGQRITAFLKNRASSYLSLRVTKPDGSSWYSDYSYWDGEIDNVTLPSTGDYMVTVNARDDGQGNYTAAVNLLSDPPTPISYDQPLDDNLSPFGDQDTFVFQGAAGQRITAFLKNRASSYLSLRVTKPDGSSWYSDYKYWDGEIDNVTLPATGEYTVTVNARDDGQGNYAIVVNLLGDREQTISYDQAVDDIISPFGDQDTFVFQGTAGHHITAFLDNRTSAYLSLRVSKPDGSSWYSDYDYWDSEIENMTLPTTGEYIVTVNGRDDATGNYTVVVNKVGEPEQTLAFDQPHEDSLSPVGDQDTYVFQGTAGQRITAFLDNRASSYLSLRVTKPDGSFWYSDYSYYDGEIDNVTLPATGEYSVTVNGRDDATGNYTVVVNLLGDQREMFYGESLAGELSPMGDQDGFLFGGGAGHRATLFLDNRSSGKMALRLFSPDGSLLRSLPFEYYDSEIRDATLPTTGCYVAVVDGEGDDVGNYTFTLNLLQGDAKAITYNQSYDDELSPACDQDDFTFDALANQHVTAYLSNRSSDSLSLRLLGPNGSTLRYQDFTAGDCEIDDITIVTPGKYTLRVDGKGNATGQYTVSLNWLNDGVEPIACADSIVLPISPAGDRDSFTFEARANHRASVSLLHHSSGRLSLRLFAPNGTAVLSCGFDSSTCEIDHEFSTEGKYTLTVDGEAGTTGDYSLLFNQMDWSSDPVSLNPSEKLESDICPAGDTDVFHFNAKAGELFTATLENLSATPLSLLLTTERGDSLKFCSSAGSSCVVDITIPQTGKYRLIVAGEGGATGEYRITRTGTVSVAERTEAAPTAFKLDQNYPNPFNPSTVIHYELPKSAHVKLKVYNATGQEIRTLEDVSKPAGYHEVVWDATDTAGRHVPSGVYFYRFDAGEFVMTRKLTVMK